jgi:UDP:flavonoid glycosyltransferase YjiC (YdhE family)
MARIVLATFGSLGDLHPVIGLALELRRRGHRPEIATTELYREKIGALGLPFHTLRPAMSVVDEALVRRMMDGRRGPTRLLRDLMLPAVRDMHADLAPVIAGADCLVASELVYAAPLVSAQTGVPWVSYSLAPISLFSVFDPSLMPGPPGTHWIQSLGPASNRLLRAAAEVVTQSWWQPVRALRRELGLPEGRNPLFEGKYSPRLDLALFSSVLQAPQPDWPAQTVQCGFPFYDEDESAAGLPPAVAEFLDAGARPVVFTLGSSAVHIADDFYVRSAQAARLLGRRALFLIGKNPPPPNLPASMLAWSYLPYARIFPHAAAVVHQGGIGTTAQALRAGRPMVVTPYAFDQPDNAARVTRRGIARTIAPRRYTAERAARELAALLDDPAVTVRAEDAAREVQRERGIAGACDAIERQLR